MVERDRDPCFSAVIIARAIQQQSSLRVSPCAADPLEILRLDYRAAVPYDNVQVKGGCERAGKISRRVAVLAKGPVKSE